MRARSIWLLAVVSVIGGTSARGAGQDSHNPVKAAGLAEKLAGTWILVGTPDKTIDPPASGGRLKFITGGHWAVTQADPTSGKVIFHHGGTYVIDGDTYSETVEYANESTADLIKKTFKFRIKMDGDTFIQTPIGPDNPYAEVWKRAK